MIGMEAAGAGYYDWRVFAKQNTREARETRMLPLRQSVFAKQLCPSVVKNSLEEE